MSNIKNITNSLQAILETVNTLPEAGSSSSGGNIETCTVTISGDVSDYYPTNVAYTTVDSNGNIVYRHDTCSTSSITITCLKNSVIGVSFAEYMNILSDQEFDELYLFGSYYGAVFYIKDDCKLINSSTISGGSN